MPRGADGLVPSERWALALDGEGAEERTLAMIAARVSEGETLSEVCRSAGWPKSFVRRWLYADSRRKGEYEFAMQLWADDLAQGTIQIADDASPEEVSKAKLQVDTRLRLASKWDRERYGDKVVREDTMLVLGLPAEFEQAAAELLRSTLARREPVLIEQGSGVAEDGFEGQRSAELSAGGIV